VRVDNLAGVPRGAFDVLNTDAACMLSAFEPTRKNIEWSDFRAQRLRRLSYMAKPIPMPSRGIYFAGHPLVVPRPQARFRLWHRQA